MARIVIAGGSAAGLASALALSGKGHDIVILDRGASEWSRPAEPQTAHTHTLTSLGVKVLREHAPQLLTALYEAGAVEFDLLAAMPYTVTDRARVDGDDELVALGCRRTTFEVVLYRMVRALPGVEIRHGTGVHGLELDATGRRVTGVRTGDGRTVTAEIVVDATGRRAESRNWLAEAGVPVAEDWTSPSGLSWYARSYRLLGSRRPGPLNRGDAAGLVGDTYAGLLHPGDRGTFSVVLGVLPGDRALSQLRLPAEFGAAARLTPGLGAWLEDGVSEPVSAVHSMTITHNALRGVATPRQRPVAGLFVTGDAACVTNPLSGHGLSLAFAHAFQIAGQVAGAPVIDIALSRRVARLTEELYAPWFRQSAEDDCVRIARWRAAIAGIAAASSDAVLTDAADWRALTRTRMGLLVPDELTCDDSLRDSAALTARFLAPSRPELIKAVNSASEDGYDRIAERFGAVA